METDMKTKTNQIRRARTRGFSLIELMVVVVMISIVLAAILTQVDQVQQRATAEQGKVDDFQQARDFVAQVVREGRQMGYPNYRNFDTTLLLGPPFKNDPSIAAGLVKLTQNELDFEGDIDGSGVSDISYKINGDGACALCMERAQAAKKIKGSQDPLLDIPPAAAYVQMVQNVQNTAAGIATPIFSAFDASGNQVVLPIDIDNNPIDVARVRLIRINLAVANPLSFDPKTKQQLEADITGSLQIVNCSMAASQSQVQAASASYAPGFLQVGCKP